MNSPIKAANIWIASALLAMLVLGALAIQQFWREPLSRDEDLCVFIAQQLFAGLKDSNRDERMLLTIEGLSAQDKAASRKRIISHIGYHKITVIDALNFKSPLKSFKDPVTGKHAHEVLIRIVEWRSDREVVVETSFVSAPLVGGGGKTLIRKTDNGWELVEKLESWVT